MKVQVVALLLVAMLAVSSAFWYPMYYPKYYPKYYPRRFGFGGFGGYGYGGYGYGGYGYGGYGYGNLFGGYGPWGKQLLFLLFHFFASDRVYIVRWVATGVLR